MKEDVMVIPLRVPRELGRSWKMEAVKQDKSVQKWILEQVGDNRRERSSVASALVKRQANPAALDETNKGRTPSDTIQRTGAAIKGGSTPSTPATPEEVEAKQRSCKHAFVSGARACVKCNWVPPILS